MIDEVIARLTDQAPSFKQVAGAAAFQAAAESNPLATPAAYVLPLGERPEPNGLDNEQGVEQRVNVSIGIVIVLSNVADAQGAAAGSDLAALRGEVKAALLGWAPASADEVMERGPSSLLAFRDQHLWWQDTYTTAYYERSY